MKLILKTFLFTALCTGSLIANGQQHRHSHRNRPIDTVLRLPPPPPVMHHAGFDVIITLDGEILYGLVKEVDEVFIKYQRTDIPDGPVYTIRRNQVYAISYRNQVKEYITPVYGDVRRTPGMAPMGAGVFQPGGSRFGNNGAMYPYYSADTGYMLPLKDTLLRKVHLARQGNFRIGLGFIRGFTKVEDADKYSAQATFPAVSLAYDKVINPSVRAGIMLTFGTRKFTGERFSSYDSTNISSDIKENIFSLMVYGKQSIGDRFSNLRPYLMGGIGINSGNVQSTNLVKFTNNNPQVLQVSSGGRAVSLGLMARLGADYFFNNKVGAFADVGFGAAIIQVGAVFNLE